MYYSVVILIVCLSVHVLVAQSTKTCKFGRDVEQTDLIFTKLLLYYSLVVHSCMAYPINVILTGYNISVNIDTICLF